MWPWGSAIACTVRRSEQLLHSLQGFKGFKGKRLRPGKRQAWTPITGQAFACAAFFASLVPLFFVSLVPLFCWYRHFFL